MAGGAGRAAIRRPGAILAGLVGLVFAAVTVLGAIGFLKLEERHNIPITDAPVAGAPDAGAPDQLARGAQLAWACSDCHSPEQELPLGGSIRSLLDGGPPMGVIYATNLTPGGPLKGWTDGEIVRAIREGID